MKWMNQNFKRLKDTLCDMLPWSIEKFDGIQNRLPDIKKSAYEQAEFNKRQLPQIKERLRIKREKVLGKDAENRKNMVV